MRIIGIDPGTGIVGFGVIDSDGRKHQLVDAGVIRTPAHQDLELRLKTIYDGVQEIIKTNKPTIMVIEKLYFARNVTTAMSVSHARGVIMLAGIQAGLKIYEYTPLQIKQALTGYGRAEKSQIQAMVKAALNLASCPKPDDCADALAAALTYATAPPISNYK
jgi:crossover junction endodeoxyribonuclease RuvC